MRQRPRVLITVLALLGLSVALNIFMIGYAAHDFRETAATGTTMETIAGIYPPEIRQEFRAVMRESRPRTFTALRDLRAARADLASAIKTSPLDEAAVQAAMKKVRDATDNLQATLQDYLLTAMRRSRDRPAS